MRLITTKGGQQLTIQSEGRITGAIAASCLSAYNYAPKANLKKVVLDLEGVDAIDQEAWKFWLVLAERAKHQAIEVAIDYPKDFDVSRLPLPLQLTRHCRCLPRDAAEPGQEAAGGKNATPGTRQAARGY